MPIYEFECADCGARFEDLVPAGTEEASCRECGAGGAHRRLSSFGAVPRQPTAAQRRRMEDARGTNRDGARKRWGERMKWQRERRGRPGRGGGAG